MIAKSSAGPSGVERLTARKPGPRIAQRSVTMDCQIRNHHVRYREHVVAVPSNKGVHRSGLSQAVWSDRRRRNPCRDLNGRPTMKASVCDLPTIDIIALRKDQQSTGYGRAGDRMTHLHGRIDRFTSGE